MSEKKSFYIISQLSMHHDKTCAEMIPELIVPDMYDCKLKPYVSYKTKEINQEKLTSR